MGSAHSRGGFAWGTRLRTSGLGPGALLGCCIPAHAQESVSPRADAPLILTGTIALPNVDGRIDHFALDPGGRIFVCVIGNDTVEVLETLTEKRVHTITGVPHPQGVVYVPEFKKLFVGSRDGKLYVFDGTSFDLLSSIDFHDDVDNLRYDGATERVFAAYGDGETAGIAMIDAATNQRLADQFKTGAHPESFQLESSGPRIFVNLPDSKEIAVINRATRAIIRWPLAKMDGNFPMALESSIIYWDTDAAAARCAGRRLRPRSRCDSCRRRYG